MDHVSRLWLKRVTIGVDEKHAEREGVTGLHVGPSAITDRQSVSANDESSGTGRTILALDKKARILCSYSSMNRDRPRLGDESIVPNGNRPYKK